MSAQVLWVWNSWGLLALAGVALWMFLSIAVSAFVRGLYALRGPLTLLLGLPSIAAGCVLNGWLVGLLNLIIGVVAGTVVARVIVLARGGV